VNFRDINGRHEGQDVYVLGSGPSLVGYDLSQLSDKTVIAVNHSIEFFNAQYLVFGDAMFLKSSNYDFNKYSGVVVTPHRHNDSARLQFIPEERKYFFEPRRDEPHINAKMGLFHPCSSGIMALSLAIQFRARKIYLLGFDYCYNGDTTHFFGNIYKHHLEYKETKVLKKKDKFFRFNKWRKIIYNCSDISTIKEFERIPLNAVLHRASA
jgi:hypothetical protein